MSSRHSSRSTNKLLQHISKQVEIDYYIASATQKTATRRRPCRTFLMIYPTSRQASLVDYLEIEWTLHAVQGGQHRVLQLFLVSEL